MSIQIACHNCGNTPDKVEDWVATVELKVPDSNTELTHRFCTHSCFAEWCKTMPNENYEEGFGEYYRDESYISN